MEYFNDLNPYLVRQEAPSDNTTPATNNNQVVEQTYVENILRLNIGKRGTFYFTYNGSTEWRDQQYTGIIEQAGRDHLIIKDVNSERRTMLLLVYLLWVEFDEPVNYQYPRI